MKKAVLKNVAIFTGKHLCWSLFLIKLRAFRPATILKRDSNTGVSFEYCEVFKNTYLKNIWERLLLHLLTSMTLTYFMQLISFYTLLKQKTSSFLVFEGCKETSSIKWVNNFCSCYIVVKSYIVTSQLLRLATQYFQISWHCYINRNCLTF